MYKYITTFALLFIIFFGTASVKADGLGVFGSFWEPADGGDTRGLGARIRGGKDAMYYVLRGTYFEDIQEEREMSVVDLQVIPVDLGLGLQTQNDEGLILYGGIGASYYFIDRETFDDVDDEYGWYLEAGIEFGFNEGLGVLIEGVWRRVEGDVDDEKGTLLSDTTIDLEGFSLNVGLLFVW